MRANICLDTCFAHLQCLYTKFEVNARSYLTKEEIILFLNDYYIIFWLFLQIKNKTKKAM